jgi:hypothetical protein
MIGDLRRIVYHVRDDLGFRLKKVTLDGFQSTDTLQQLRKRRFETELVSVDRSMLPYSDLRDALYEDRIEFPEYIVHMKRGDMKKVEVVYKELSELEDKGNKIDHPATGTKDVADAMAGVAYTLMGDRSYRRNVRDISTAPSQLVSTGTEGGRGWGGLDVGPRMPAIGSLPPLSVPPPPRILPGVGVPRLPK